MQGVGLAPVVRDGLSLLPPTYCTIPEGDGDNQPGNRKAAGLRRLVKVKISPAASHGPPSRSRRPGYRATPRKKPRPVQTLRQAAGPTSLPRF